MTASPWRSRRPGFEGMDIGRTDVGRKRDKQVQQRFEDPVCGMEVSYKTAAAESSYHGRRYYFCADVCREAFEADPERYVSPNRRA